MAAIAKVLASINGAPNTSGGLDVPSGAEIQLSAESTVGWTQAFWEFFDYPEGWTAPDGWSTRADGTVYFDGYTPPAFTMPENTTLWGVWMLRLSVIADNDPSVTHLDEATCFSLLSPKGQRGIGAREASQFTTSTTRVKKWLRSLQRNQIAIEQAIDVGRGSVVGELVKAMADANQTLTVNEAANPFIDITGTLTAVRQLNIPLPTSSDDVTECTIRGSHSGYDTLVRGIDESSTLVGQEVVLSPGHVVTVQLTTTGLEVLDDPPLDPRKFGAKLDGVTNDLPALQAMHDSVPVGITRPVKVLWPRGQAQAYCADHWEISRPLRIYGMGPKYAGTTSAKHGLLFAPMKQLIVHGNASSADGGRADNGCLKGLSITSLMMCPTQNANWGALGYLMSTSSNTWTQLPATVALGTCVVRASASVDPSAGGYYGDGVMRDTTHLVYFECTTAGTKGSSAPAEFATAGRADIGTTISASGGTAVWTVRGVPKDYSNGKAYYVGDRVVPPGINEHVFEALSAGTSIAFASTTLDAAEDTLALSGQSTLTVASTADFPPSGIICVVTSAGRQFVQYTGKTTAPDTFTVCTNVTGLKPRAGTMSTGGAVTGPYPYAFAGVPVRCVTSMVSPSHRRQFFDHSTQINNSSGYTLGSLPGTITVDSTAGFSSSGSLYVWATNGSTTSYAVIDYTNKTDNAFTGCTTSATGTIADNAEVAQVVQHTTTSGGATLPQGTINVASTTGFASSGHVLIWTGTGAKAKWDVVKYAGITATSFTDCTGGTGTYASGAFVIQGQVVWQEIFGGLVHILSNLFEVEDFYIAGSTGAAIKVHDSYNFGSPSGGSNFGAIRHGYIRNAGSGIVKSGGNTNGGIVEDVEFDQMGMGRTNVDAPNYLNNGPTTVVVSYGDGVSVNISEAVWGNASGAKFGNAGYSCWAKSGYSIWRDTYTQTSGGPAHSNASTSSNGVGTAAYFSGCQAESVVYDRFMAGGIVDSISKIHEDSTVQYRNAASAFANRNWTFRVPYTKLVSSTQYYIDVDIAKKTNSIAAALRFRSDRYAGVLFDLTLSDDWNQYSSSNPAGWWIWGRGGSQGYGTTQNIAFYWAGASGTWPGGATVDSGTAPTWILQDRLWIGRLLTAHPRSIGFATSAPAAENFRRGSFTFNGSPSLGGALGWVCTTAGTSGGTQTEVSAVYWRSSDPSGGAETWTAPAVVMNSSAASGQPAGWICTASGTPGTWVAMANCP